MEALVAAFNTGVSELMTNILGIITTTLSVGLPVFAGYLVIRGGKKAVKTMVS